MQAISAIVLDRFSPARLVVVSWLSLALLVCAVAVVIGAEWPRLRERLGLEARRKRQRARRKAQWKVVRGDAEDFAASVERDLENLPTLDESDHYK
jgi:hypothetical protein